MIRSLLIIACLTLAGCGTTGNGDGETTRYGTTLEVDNPDIPLEQYIARLSGVSVFGSGSSARVELIRSTSIQQDTRPLFVVDGIRVGRDFSEVYSMIRMINVESVQVLRSSRATQLYGTDGGFGAIVINMKK